MYEQVTRNIPVNVSNAISYRALLLALACKIRKGD
jgi:hypothetical protein